MNEIFYVPFTIAAEKCRADKETSPHEVLGFRDMDIHHLVGHNGSYSKDDSVGAWVLQSQQYSTGPFARVQQQEMMLEHQQKPQQNIYASIQKPSPPVMPVAPPVVLREPDQHQYQRLEHPQGQMSQNSENMNHYNGIQQQHQHNTTSHYGLKSPNGNYNHIGNQVHQNTATYGQINHRTQQKPQFPPHHMMYQQQKQQQQHIQQQNQRAIRKPAPPPPRRSENTQLTTN